MKKLLLFILLLPGLAFSQIKTTFQVASKWLPTIDARCDGAILYGFIGLNQEAKDSWTASGYKTQAMIGIAWGGYKDYFSGEWDGEKHLEEVAQRDENGDIIWHGKDTPYIIPTMNYLSYLKEKIRKLVDAGITEIFLEEPEIWLAAGYGEAFKREWKDYYNEEWKPQKGSPENTYRANKLKHFLYYRAIKEITTDIKSYGKEKGIDVKCYIATHSVINYSLWNIVSPEASLSNLPSVDGFIAQVWTGTSRYPNLYEGYYKTRLFEMAFMEYGALEALSKPVGKDMYFLTDPIEDAPQHWELYKNGYEATYTAELLYPDVDKYEVMPWPGRIYHGKFKTSPYATQAEKIPDSYATQMQIMINALYEMPKTKNRVSGPQGISVLLSNSLMFQRCVKDLVYDYEDELLSNYYGLVMPLIKRGIPVSNVHMDNLENDCLEDTKILLVSYSSMKPVESKYHDYIASWVKKGGILLYISRDNDRFQTIKDWWSEYKVPSNHLFSLMGIESSPKTGTYTYGKGRVIVMRNNPDEFIKQKGGYENLLLILKEVYNKKLGNFNYSNYFTLSRGKFDVTSVLKESVSDEPVIKKGLYVDLFTDSLPVVKDKAIYPGKQSLMVCLDRVNKSKPSVLATAARAYDESYDSKHYSFITKGPKGIKAVTRVYLPYKPSSVKIDNAESFNESNWNQESSTYLLKYNCNPDGTKISFSR